MDDWKFDSAVAHTYAEDDDDLPLDHLNVVQGNSSRDYCRFSTQLKACFIAAAAVAHNVAPIQFEEYSLPMDLPRLRFYSAAPPLTYELG